MDTNSVAGSVAFSKVSVTKSEVSQVDFKFRSNDIKKKVRVLLRGVDSDKSGFVKQEVFYELLKLHKIDLSPSAIQNLNKICGKNDLINYKEALNQITIDLAAAGSVDETSGVGGSLKWTI